jgi:hypothetical protein
MARSWPTIVSETASSELSLKPRLDGFTRLARAETASARGRLVVLPEPEVAVAGSTDAGRAPSSAAVIVPSQLQPPTM